MDLGSVVYWAMQAAIGVYMLGIGFRFLPDPVKSSSMEKHRGMFKLGGICVVLQAAISVLR